MARKAPTDVIRVEADIASMLSVIVAVEKRSVSDLVSPVIRPLVEKWYDEALKKAQKLRPGKSED